MITYLIDPSRAALVQSLEMKPADLNKFIRRYVGDDDIDFGTINEDLDHIACYGHALFQDRPYVFSIQGYQWPLAGRCVVFGVDPDGESQSPAVAIEKLQGQIGFMGRCDTRVAWREGKNAEGELIHFTEIHIDGQRFGPEALP